MSEKVNEVSLAEEYNQQGLTLMGANKYEEAITYFNKAQQENPMLVDTYFNLGTAYASMENYDEAKVQFEKILLIDKNNPMAYFHLGNISFMKNDFNKGIENYNKAVSCGYDGSQLYYNLGLVYEEMDNIPMAIRNYNKAIAKEPLRPDFRLKKASLYIQTKKYDEAMEALEELNNYCPDVFEGYHLRFEIYCAQEKYDEAEKLINKAIDLFPEDVSLFYDKIRLFNIKGELDTALRMIDEAEKMEGFEIEARNLDFERAKIYAQKNDIDKAIEYFEKLKEYEEGSIDYEGRYFLMNAYLSIQKFDKVLENAETLLKNLNDTSYSRAAIYYKPYSLKMLGREEEAQKYYKEATKVFRMITISEPGNLDAYMFRVLSHKDLKEYDKALELVDYVLLLKPDSAEAYAIKSGIYKELGQEEKAQEELKKAKRLNPLLDIDYSNF
ncbi:MAG: tetratricopeptide repeat protein [Clostridium sp.]|nr:tetratricopeptide repeat protein [Clostridium sp.]